MRLDEYIDKEMNVAKDEFMNKCYAEGEQRIKSYIAIGAIVNKENIEVNSSMENGEEFVSSLINKTTLF